jgi:hypothetical protein
MSSSEQGLFGNWFGNSGQEGNSSSIPLKRFYKDIDTLTPAERRYEEAMKKLMEKKEEMERKWFGGKSRRKIKKKKNKTKTRKNRSNKRTKRRTGKASRH